MLRSPLVRAAVPLSLALLASAYAGAAASPSRPKPEPAARPVVDPTLFSGLKWREAGPFRGGRVAAVTGVPGDRETYFFGGRRGLRGALPKVPS